ncbi:PREDICTED: interleukin-25 isoform X2 [Condylura cristata]|nr:PREDICTED: interleukin-25 isoform X2 [Condylura cristata]
MVMGAHTLSLRLQRDGTHWPSCCHDHRKGHDPTEEWLKWNSVPASPPEAASLADSTKANACSASEDGPLSSRSISPWTYVLDRDLNRLPQDLYQAQCLCKHCVSLRTGSHMDPQGNSVKLYHNQTVFYRQPCPRQHGAHSGYCLEPKLYPVSMACVCVRPRVVG